MLKNKRLLGFAGAGLVLVALVGGGAMATGATGGDNEEPITGEALDQASAAALAHTGGGTVTETEVGDEDSYYEVEVTLDDGSQVDVQLDRDFNVVGDKVEKGGETDDDGPNGDQNEDNGADGETNDD